MITAHPSAPDGLVAPLTRYSASDFPADSAILCRNSAPLVAFAFSLLRRRVACHILGRDLAVGLEKLLDKVTFGSFEATCEALSRYQQRESDRLRRKGKKQEAANVEDRCSCLQFFLQQEGSVDAAKRRIQSMFKAGPGVTLATVHKAKGLEWNTVFLLDRDALMPSRYAEAAWEKQQEKNLIYVAYTRARVALRFIQSGDWAP